MRRLVLLLVLLAIAIAAQAPAWLLVRSVIERSGGMVELRNATGSLWSGQADAVIGGKSAGEREIAAGRIAWRAERIDWKHRSLVLVVSQTPAAPRPATLALGADRIGFAGGARLPASIAGRIRLLAGWTVAGDLVVDSDAMEWTDGSRSGTATVLWRNATLVPPDLPGGFALGEVSALIALDGASAVVSVRNSGGDIELTGDASSRTGAVKLLVQPRAGALGASGAQTAWLQSHTMGRSPGGGFTIDASWPGR